MRMRTLILIMGALLIILLLACDDLAQVQDESVPAATPMTPATPEQPEASGANPTTPRPAPTPAQASNPLSVMTPLAVLPSYTPEPVPTSSPTPAATAVTSEAAQEKRSEYLVRCKNWALTNMEPLVYSKFERLDPYNMTDLERALWGSRLVNRQRSYIDNYYEPNGREFANNHLEWCQDYWSEALDESNASKRNHELFQSSCLMALVEEGRTYQNAAERIYSEFEELGMSSVIVNQAIRLLNWMDIDGDALLMLEEMPYELVDRVWARQSSLEGRYEQQNRLNEWPKDSVLRSEKEWWGIEGVWEHREIGLCKSYYPQLFFGRWVPLDDFGMDERLEEAQDKLNEARDRDDWPDWADGPDRDILIRLDDMKTRAEVIRSPAVPAPAAPAPTAMAAPAAPAAPAPAATTAPAPTAMAAPAAPTAVPSTNTPVPPTSTPVPPTATPRPTNTPVPPTATPEPTNTPVPPTSTPVPPTATPRPTNTPVPPTATPEPTAVPTATPQQSIGELEAPTITNVDNVTAKMIKITFSEPVLVFGSEGVKLATSNLGAMDLYNNATCTAKQTGDITTAQLVLCFKTTATPNAQSRATQFIFGRGSSVRDIDDNTAVTAFAAIKVN